MTNYSFEQATTTRWKLAHGVALKYCSVRETWLLIAPERLFILNSTAFAVVELLDGRRSTSEIVEKLSTHWETPSKEQIKGDVTRTLLLLFDRRAISF